MKSTAIKAAVAALLLAPVLSFAAFTKNAADSENVSLLSGQSFTVVSTWTDAIGRLGDDDHSKATKTYEGILSWKLTNLLGTTVFDSGTFTDLVGGPETASKTFMGLAAGSYKFTLSGIWKATQRDAELAHGGAPTINVAPISPVPEPETYAMLLAGLGLIGTIAMRRNTNGS